jgi:hypothetical protein
MRGCDAVAQTKVGSGEEGDVAPTKCRAGPFHCSFTARSRHSHSSTAFLQAKSSQIANKPYGLRQISHKGQNHSLSHGLFGVHTPLQLSKRLVSTFNDFYFFLGSRCSRCRPEGDLWCPDNDSSRCRGDRRPDGDDEGSAARPHP